MRRNGLNNLPNPLFSTKIVSIKKIDNIGATSWLPGETNQIDKNKAKKILKVINLIKKLLKTFVNK